MYQLRRVLFCLKIDRMLPIAENSCGEKDDTISIVKTGEMSVKVK